ncbi:MAG: hybrid sensor histidine kinase/response regulator [Candidatus Kariarchaeaceae archaeon]|jgi:PAS domain S-box-containing protein
MGSDSSDILETWKNAQKIQNIIRNEVNIGSIQAFLDEMNEFITKYMPDINLSLLFLDRSSDGLTHFIIFRSKKFTGFTNPTYDELFYNVTYVYENTLQYKVIEEKAPVCINDFDDKCIDDDFDTEDIERYRSYGFKSVLLVPISFGDNCFAHFNFYSLDHRLDLSNPDEIISNLMKISNESAYFLHQFFVNWRYEATFFRFNDFLNHVTDLFFSIRNDGTLIYGNREFMKLIGLSHYDFVQKHIFDILPDIRNIFRVEMSPHDFVDKHDRIEGEFEYFSKALGKRFTYEIIMWTSTSPYEKNIMHGIARDITIRKEFEEESIKTQKLESIGLLAGGLAHDLNNLLTVISGNVTLLRLLLMQDGDFDKQESLEIIESIDETATTIGSLSNQLLTFSRGGDPIYQVIDLISLVQETVLLFITGTRIKPEFQIDVNEALVEIDDTMIKQVISNLVLNSLAAMKNKADPVLRVIITDKSKFEDQPEWKKEMDDHSDMYIIHVLDNGEGIDKKHRKKIFDPFFTTKEQGSGLGLATSNSIIKRHGGVLTVDSKLGEGAIFSFTLRKSSKELIPKAIEMSNILSSLRVFVLDDNEHIRDLLKRFLTTMNHQVETFARGQDLLQSYKEALKAKEQPDLVILDLTIVGGMGGKETFLELKKVDSEVRTMVMSGYTEDETLSNYEELGFNSRLLKPFTIDQLIYAINLIFQI